jgi:hypothetical protein
MKRSRVFKGVLLGLSLLLAASGFAAEKGSMSIYDPVSVGGKQLNSGTYTVQWEGSGPNVELSILKGKKVVATSPAHVVEVQSPSNHSAAVVKTNGDGSASLSEIRFEGRKFILAIDNGESAGSSSSSGSGMR